MEEIKTLESNKTIYAGLDAIQKKLISERPDEHQLYIPLQGTHTTMIDEEPFDLQSKVHDFLHSANVYSSGSKVLLLLGNTGSGKSMFSQNLHVQLWKNYQSGQPIPLWIPLPELEKPFEGAVEEVLSKLGFDESQLNELKANEQFIFIVDGYDELHRFQNVYVSNGWSTWNAKIVMTCRSQAIYYQKDYEKFFMPFEREKRLPHLLKKLYVAPFSEQKIESYLKQYHQVKGGDVITQEQMDQVPGLSTLIRTPFLLHMAVEALPAILSCHEKKEENERRDITQAELYDVFIEQWFARQEKKLKTTGHQSEEDLKPRFWAYCQSLAQEMHAKQISQIVYNNRGATGRLFGKTKKENPWKRYFDGESAVIRSACPLKKTGENRYGFIHDSMIEYFATRAMYEDALEDKKTNEKIDDKGKKEEDSERHLQAGLEFRNPIHRRLFTHEHGGIGGLCDRIIGNKKFKNYLFSLVQHSKKDARYAVAAANAITAINRSGEILSGLDLSEVNIPYAVLDGAICDHTNFRGANIEHVSFRNACLHNADFSEARALGLDFGELPALEHSEPVTCMASTGALNQRYLATSTGKEVFIWKWEFDFGVWRRTHTLKTQNKNVSALAWVLDNDTGSAVLVSGDEAGILHAWDPITGECCGEKNCGEPVANIQKFKLLSSLSVELNTQTFHAYVKRTPEMSSPNKRTFTFELTQKIASKQVYGFDKLVLTSPLMLASFSINNKHRLELRDFNDEKSLKTFTHSAELTICAYAPEKNIGVAADIEGRILLWNLSDDPSPYIFAGHKGTITALLITEDEQHIISAGKDQCIKVWSCSDYKLVKTLWANQGTISQLEVLDNGAYLYSAGEKSGVKRWPLFEDSLLERLKTQEISVVSMVQPAGNNQLFCATEKGELSLWRQSTHEWKESKTIALGCGQIWSLASDSKGDLVALGCEDGVTRLWDVKQNQVCCRIYDKAFTYEGIKAITGVAMTANGKWLVAGSETGKVCLWNVSDVNHVVLLWSSPVCAGAVWSVAISQDGGKIFAADQLGIVLCWRIEKDKEGSPVRIVNHSCFNTYKSPVFKLVYNGERELLASVGRDGQVCVWKVNVGNASLQYRVVHVGVLDIIFNTDDLLTVGADGQCRLWDYTKAESKSILQLGAAIVAVSKDNENIYTMAKLDGTLQRWEYVSDENSWLLLWATSISTINIEGIKLNNIAGLSLMNKQLIAQRQTVDVICDLSSDSRWIKKIDGYKVRLGGCVESQLRDDSTRSFKEISSRLNITKELNLTADFILLLSKIGHFEGVTSLIEAGSDVETRDLLGNTLLMRAAAAGSHSIVRYLLSMGAKIDAVNKSGLTALHFALHHGSQDVAELLIEFGSDVNIETNSGVTALIYAAMNGNVLMIKKLVECGANVNQVTKTMATALLGAVMMGKREVAHMLIKYGAHLNNVDVYFHPPLLMAIERGFSEIVQDLLEANADVNAKYVTGATALSLAISYKHESIIKRLIDAGANVKLTTDAGSFLHLAIKNKLVNIVQLLIEKGLDVNERNKEGLTPLMAAAAVGCGRDMVALLIASGADIGAINPFNGATALFYTAFSGHDDIMDLLCKEVADLNIKVNIGAVTTLLCMALQNRHDDVVRKLITLGADVNIVNGQGFSPLHLAVGVGNYVIAEQLITAGSTVNVLSNEKKTPLFIAAEYGHEALVELLLDNGADIQLAAACRITALHVAVGKGHKKMAELLIKHGANPDAKNEDGFTPLHFACMRQKALVPLLINAKVDVNVTTKNEGVTPLYFASMAGFHQAVELLLSKKANLNAKIKGHDGMTALHVASRCGHVDVMSLLLDAGADKNAISEEGVIPLMCAVQSRNVHVVKLLLDEKTDLNKVDKKGLTALSCAAQLGNMEAVSLLLEAGASVDLANNWDVTPLMWAAEKGYDDIVECLIHYGTNVNAVDDEGFTPLIKAAAQGHYGIVHQLVTSGVSVGTKTLRGFTALYVAAELGHDLVVEFLLNNEANVNETSSDGYTAYDIASFNKHDSVMRLLLQYGATKKNNKLVLLKKLYEEYADAYNACDIKLLISKVTEILELAPDSCTEHHNLACYLHVNGDVQLAEKHFLESIKLLSHSGIHCEYGLFLFCQNRYEDAIFQFSIAIALDDDRSLSYGKLEKVWFDQYIQGEIGNDKLTLKAKSLAFYLLIKIYMLDQIKYAVQTSDTLALFKVFVYNQTDAIYYRLLSYIYHQLGFENDAQALILNLNELLLGATARAEVQSFITYEAKEKVLDANKKADVDSSPGKNPHTLFQKDTSVKEEENKIEEIVDKSSDDDNEQERDVNQTNYKTNYKGLQ